MLFCLVSESFPVGSFVICVCVSVASWGDTCFGGDDDWEVVRTKGFDHLPGCCGGEVGRAKGDVWR